jgi:hypothetical protein
VRLPSPFTGFPGHGGPREGTSVATAEAPATLETISSMHLALSTPALSKHGGVATSLLLPGRPEEGSAEGQGHWQLLGLGQHSDHSDQLHLPPLLQHMREICSSGKGERQHQHNREESGTSGISGSIGSTPEKSGSLRSQEAPKLEERR